MIDGLLSHSGGDREIVSGHLLLTMFSTVDIPGNTVADSGPCDL